MRDRPWVRAERIEAVRDRIWSHLTLAAGFGGEDLLTAEALLQWPEDASLRLGEHHFLLCREVRTFLDDVPSLLRRLTTSSVHDEEVSLERVNGPIRWSKTFAYRAMTGSRFGYVTAPARRVHQTPENELLVHVLDAIATVGRNARIESETSRQAAAATAREVAGAAERWRQSRPLTQIDRVTPTARSISRIRSSRNRTRLASTLAAYDQHQSLLVDVDRQAIRAAIEGSGLVTAAEGTLFELLCLFEMLDSLSAAGWTMNPIRTFRGRVRVSGRRADGRRLDVWYQGAPPELFTSSRYVAVLEAHGFSRSQPRPDMTLRWTDHTDQTRLLLVECQLSQRNGVDHAARRALGDLLSYRRAFNVALQAYPEPYGLGIAWGQDLVANHSEISLCSPDRIREFVTSAVN